MGDNSYVKPLLKDEFCVHSFCTRKTVWLQTCVWEFDLNYVLQLRTMKYVVDTMYDADDSAGTTECDL